MKEHPFLSILLLVIGIFMFGYFIVSGVTFAVCYCFGFSYSWKLSLGVYIVVLLVRKLIKEVKRK